MRLICSKPCYLWHRPLKERKRHARTQLPVACERTIAFFRCCDSRRFRGERAGLEEKRGAEGLGVCCVATVWYSVGNVWEWTGIGGHMSYFKAISKAAINYKVTNEDRKFVLFVLIVVWGIELLEACAGSV